MSLTLYKNIWNRNFRLKNISKLSPLGVKNHCFSGLKSNINHKLLPLCIANRSFNRNYCIQTKQYANIIEEFFDGFRYDDITLSSPIYSTKIDTTDKNKRKPDIYYSTKAFQESVNQRGHEENLKEIESIINNNSMDEYAYYVIIDYCLKKNDIEKAEMYLQKLLDDKTIEATCFTFNTFIRHFIDKGDIKTARTYWLKMEEHNIRPLSTNFNVLIPLTVKDGEIEKGSIKSLESYMYKYKARPDKIFYHSLLKILIQLEKYDYAAEIVDLFFKKNYKINRKIFTTLIMYYSKTKKIEELENLVKRRKEFNILPDNILLNTVLNCYYHTQQYEKAIKLYEDWTKTFHIEPDKKTSSTVQRIKTRLKESKQNINVDDIFEKV